MRNICATVYVFCPVCNEQTSACIEMVTNGHVPIVKNTCDCCGVKFFTTSTINIDVSESA